MKRLKRRISAAFNRSDTPSAAPIRNWSLSDSMNELAERLAAEGMIIEECEPVTGGGQYTSFGEHIARLMAACRCIRICTQRFCSGSVRIAPDRFFASCRIFGMQPNLAANGHFRLEELVGCRKKLLARESDAISPEKALQQTK
ncbi:unnamed protein product [Toxocara canis]|uniref:Resolvase/invertase-type recombinase catalytic domain-containing protein n=1 Tax=Toxocara canis TaxID=6265 RepID=A0A183U016_TOXCA|nr:unnamed protein product [Toxocara canis]